MFFYLWLLELKEVITSNGEKIRTTTVKFETLQESYLLNYKSPYDLMRFWLLPMKTKIEVKRLGVSFRYNINKDNANKIDIVAFLQKPDEALESAEISANMITYKLSYLTRLYSLSKVNKEVIRNLLKEDYFLFISKYEEFIKICSKEKVYAKNYKDDSFLDKIKSLYA